MSRLFSQTWREVPAEVETASHQLLLRAGFVRQLAAGIYSYLPLARRSLNKIEAILRKEMDAIGGQEVTMPVVHPADVWRESGRYFTVDAEMTRFKDRYNRDMVLAMTHEEVVADLVRREIRSSRQLPALIYHIQTKWRDDPRPRAGLIRVREFTMKDSYSLDATWDGLDQQYQAHYQVYFKIFKSCDLPVIAVKADVGMMGGQLAHEFIYLTAIGEDTIVICDLCGYTANRQIARIKKEPGTHEDSLPLVPVATPDCKTIKDLANFLQIPESRTAKAVFMVATMPDTCMHHLQFVFAIIRGDMDVNETKLANAIRAKELRPATEAEIRAVGGEPGYASPIGIMKNSPGALPVLVIADDLIPLSPNLVAGANQAGYHLQNVNFGRDFQAEIIADIALAREGDGCPECGSPLRAQRGVEVGNIFKLGTRYSEAFGCTFRDTAGNLHPIIMGSYGIGSGRLLACIAEEHHDEKGLVWPITVAPYSVHLVMLPGKKEAERVSATCEKLYADLQSAGIEVLFDDRPESAGVKFNDADLIGIPLRITVSEKTVASDEIELKKRSENERRTIPISIAIERLQQEINDLFERIGR
jgi:prolyl-tRNA synthetase